MGRKKTSWDTKKESAARATMAATATAAAAAAVTATVSARVTVSGYIDSKDHDQRGLIVPCSSNTAIESGLEVVWQERTRQGQTAPAEHPTATLAS
jgi:hypothetical protein